MYKIHFSPSKKSEAFFASRHARTGSIYVREKKAHRIRQSGPYGLVIGGVSRASGGVPFQ